MSQIWETFKARYEGKLVGLLGIGVSNRAALEPLVHAGAFVSVRDQNPNQSEALSAYLDEHEICCSFGETYLEEIDESVLLRSPGVRLGCELWDFIQKYDIELTSEMAIFLSLCPAKIFAVTGSDGKTTTTTLIAEMLKKQAEREGARVYLGGNIGNPLLPYVFEMTENDYVVLELSSFQLFDMTCAPDVAVITNITPNHLNWHADMEEYIESKANIFADQTAHDRLVVCADQLLLHQISENVAAKRSYFSAFGATENAPSCYLCGGELLYTDENGVTEKIMDRADIKLRGMHNVMNYMAAVAAVYGYVKPEDMLAVAREFAGVRHRIQYVAQKRGVSYYNSSIDTSPTRTIAALSSFDEKLIVIVGGYDKKIPLEPLAVPLAEKAKYVVATGDTGMQVLSLLKELQFPQEQMCYLADFDEAVLHAAKVAHEGDTVLLSPAAASFDRFPNFEKRGERFMTLVAEL